MSNPIVLWTIVSKTTDFPVTGRITFIVENYFNDENNISKKIYTGLSETGTWEDDAYLIRKATDEEKRNYGRSFPEQNLA